jgi:predicted enzyme related to lactoylglutathione lyase
MSEKSKVGVIEWRDLTVDNAEEVKDFYSKVVGWDSSTLSMGDYDDYCVNLPGSDETIAGICHARGDNAKIPPQWLMYVRVESVMDSVKQCIDLGGAVIHGPLKQFGGDFCIIQDPAGAVLALLSD